VKEVPTRNDGNNGFSLLEICRVIDFTPLQAVGRSRPDRARIFAQPVPYQKHVFFLRVPEGERKHPRKTGIGVDQAPFPNCRKEDFRIGVSLKIMSDRLEIFLERPEIIDFSIVGDTMWAMKDVKKLSIKKAMFI